MKVLITGASGYVGARVFYDLRGEFDCIGTYHSQRLSEKFISLDITNPKQLQKTFTEQKPEIIIHIAANAHAAWCNAHPKEAVLLNETATQYIVDAANAIQAKVIYISSFAAIKQFDIYAKTKAKSEAIVKNTKADYTILRPSLIIGFSPNTSNDRTFNRILRMIDEKKPVNGDTSWKFQVTYLGQLSEVLKQIIARDITAEIIPVTVTELKSRYDIIKDILAPFHIPVTAIDTNDPTPITSDSLETLRRLRLPMYTYEEVMEKIINEIRNRNKFYLD